jgi:hypothetical protein
VEKLQEKTNKNGKNNSQSTQNPTLWGSSKRMHTILKGKFEFEFYPLFIKDTYIGHYCTLLGPRCIQDVLGMHT